MYILPAAVVWGMIAVILQPLSHYALVIALFTGCYALIWGIGEVFGFPLPIPGLTWQVPAAWLKGQSEGMQAFIWGCCLGPGLLTRNPYAGMGILPLLLMLSHNQFQAIGVGIAIGVAHGGGRVIGVFINRRKLKTSCTP